MKTRIILQLAIVLVLLSASLTEGLFFQYPKNALMKFFQSLHHKKEVKKQAQNIHHYHLHYYPVQSHIATKPVKAPEKHELDKFHSNHLEALGWGDHEYKHVPEPELYRTQPLRDSWPETSMSRPWTWEDEAPAEYLHQSVEQPEMPKGGIVVQVPLHQKIILQHPPTKEEKHESHPFASFFQKIKKIKNSIFSSHDESSESEYWHDEPSEEEKMNAYVVYMQPESGRKL